MSLLERSPQVFLSLKKAVLYKNIVPSDNICNNYSKRSYRKIGALCKAEIMAYCVCKLFNSWHFFATWIKWATISARSRLKLGLRISSTAQNETWLNLCVNLTIFGATSCLFFLFQAQDINSSGFKFLKISKSIIVNWDANSSWRKSKGDTMASRVSPPEDDIFLSISRNFHCILFHSCLFLKFFFLYWCVKFSKRSLFTVLIFISVKSL